jgi:hypothetical protein
VAYRVVGYVDITEATAGTWATAPTAVQGMGGNAFAGVNYGNMMPALGTYQTVGASAPHAPSSSTSFNFTSVPSWAKRITILLSGISNTNGAVTDIPLIQLGTGSTPTYTTSGYLGCQSSQFQTIAWGYKVYSAGFLTNTDHVNTYIQHGIVTLTNVGGTKWACSSIDGLSDSGRTSWGGGSIDIGAALTAIRITTENATSTFTAGTVNILVE